MRWGGGGGGYEGKLLLLVSGQLKSADTCPHSEPIFYLEKAFKKLIIAQTLPF